MKILTIKLLTLVKRNDILTSAISL